MKQDKPCFVNQTEPVTRRTRLRLALVLVTPNYLILKKPKHHIRTCYIHSHLFAYLSYFQGFWIYDIACTNVHLIFTCKLLPADMFHRLPNLVISCVVSIVQFSTKFFWRSWPFFFFLNNEIHHNWEQNGICLHDRHENLYLPAICGKGEEFHTT